MPWLRWYDAVTGLKTIRPTKFRRGERCDGYARETWEVSHLVESGQSLYGSSTSPGLGLGLVLALARGRCLALAVLA